MKTTETRQGIEMQVTGYCAVLAAGNGKRYSFTRGRDYLRVYRQDGDFRNVVCFVGADDGRVYRADSWKARGRALDCFVWDINAEVH